MLKLRMILLAVILSSATTLATPALTSLTGWLVEHPTARVFGGLAGGAGFIIFSPISPQTMLVLAVSGHYVARSSNYLSIDTENVKETFLNMGVDYLSNFDVLIAFATGFLTMRKILNQAALLRQFEEKLQITESSPKILDAPLLEAIQKNTKWSEEYAELTARLAMDALVLLRPLADSTPVEEKVKP